MFNVIGVEKMGNKKKNFCLSGFFLANLLPSLIYVFCKKDMFKNVAHALIGKKFKKFFKNKNKK